MLKEFFIGLIFLLAVSILGCLGFLLFPFLLLLAIILRFIVGIVLLFLAIWLLGKFIIFVWGKLK